MALSVNFSTLIIDSDASITDIVAFHLALRDIEDGADAAIHPVIHTYKRVDLGGGAYFHAVDFVNGWTLRFPAPGSYSIIGNINATIVPVAGVFVERTKAAAFATTSVGGSGPTAADIAAAMLDEGSGGHNTPGTIGRLLNISASANGEMTITGTPTTTSVQLSSGDGCDGFYEDCTVVFGSGMNIGAARIVASYVGATRTVTFDEPLCRIPNVGDVLVIRTDHVRPVHQIAAAVGSRTVEGTMSQDAMTRVILAALAGRTEGIGTLTEKYKSADGAKDRITVSFDASSNRTTIVLDGS